MTWMIYGANGYTGKLIAMESKRRGLTPILAGRSECVGELGTSLGFQTRIFNLDNPKTLMKSLSGIKILLHCAGPFTFTSKFMLQGCMEAGIHYLDISGEIETLEYVHSRSEELKKKNLIAIPGAGFDVVPTDCLAKMLSEKMPDAVKLILALKINSREVSGGTLKTILEGSAKGSMVREKGKITTVPVAHKTMSIDFGEKPTLSVLIPWGDVATAYYSTHIPNIEVYTATSQGQILMMKALGLVTKNVTLRKALQKIAGIMIHGPPVQTRQNGKIFLWGQVENANGKKTVMKMVTSEGYRFTVDSTLAMIDRLLYGKGARGVGALTPSMAFGSDFVLSLPGIKSI